MNKLINVTASYVVACECLVEIIVVDSFFTVASCVMRIAISS